MHHLRSSVGLLLLCALPAISASAAVLTDTFTGSPSLSWGNDSGAWDVVSDQYQATSPSSSPPAYSSLPYDLGKFAMDVDVFGALDGGVFVRSSDSTHGVALIFNHGDIYWHVVNGAWGPMLERQMGVFGNGDDIHLRVEGDGSVFKAFINRGSVPITTLTDATFADGKVALYDNAAEQGFDNVALDTATPELPAGVLALLSMAPLAWLRWRRRA
jgi:hypothetical protein